MKPKINLRLCIAGEESLIPMFEKCLKSYIKYFKIGELLIYTTENLFNEVQGFSVGKANIISIHDADKFYEENYNKFSQSVKEVLDYAKEYNYHYQMPKNKEKKLFYERIRGVMDYYLTDGTKPFIFSDIDIFVMENVKPIIDWINSDYFLYNPSFLEHNYRMCPKLVKFAGGTDFFKPLPNLNLGWVCMPTGIHFDIQEIYKIMNQDPSTWCSSQIATIIVMIKNKFKTKGLLKSLMVTKENELKNKTLAHTAPYGLNWRKINV